MERSLAAKFRVYATAAIDLLWSPVCFMCERHKRRLLEDSNLCNYCYETLTPIVPPFCDRCGESFDGEVPGLLICPNCTGRLDKYAMDFAIAAYRFDGPLRNVVHQFKFEKRLELRSLLGWLAVHGLKDSRIADRQDWLLVPVPLHAARFREREYNQSLEIAKIVKRHSGFQLSTQLHRIRPTDSQANLNRAERLKNLRGAFGISKKAQQQDLFNGRHILLVDDVLTTGSTMDECARVLKAQGGAAYVAALTVARG